MVFYLVAGPILHFRSRGILRPHSSELQESSAYNKCVIKLFHHINIIPRPVFKLLYDY